ncbi:SDR family oxidoreductase [Nocardia sp. 004]|uniref:SDR family oxidoreductase n=1 Tax=Nocardia sp. 004 TaxID=3385978 RepID=UPI0039A07A3D
MKVAVVGATGRIGSEVVEVLRNRGHEVVAISRATGVDVYTGEGLAEAMDGVRVVVDASNNPSQDTETITDFFAVAARNLQQAAHTAGTRRIVPISIIGIDNFTAGHYAGKLVQEKTLAEGPVPIRIVRAAQFHEFPGMVLDWTAHDNVAYLPEQLSQFVDLHTVAETIADVALDDSPTPALVSIAGPEQIRLADAVRQLIAHRGLPIQVTELPVDPADNNQRLSAEGALLAGPDTIIAGPTFTSWLENH